jgi:hypothetical protein
MTKPRLAFHLQTVQEYGIRRLVATVVRLTDDGIRNPSFNYTDPAADLADSKSPQPSAPTPGDGATNTSPTASA